VRRRKPRFAPKGNDRGRGAGGCAGCRAGFATGPITLRDGYGRRCGVRGEGAGASPANEGGCIGSCVGQWPTYAHSCAPGDPNPCPL